MTYLEQLHETIIQANENSLRHKDGKAWDNTKRKNAKRYKPRGKFFKKFERAEHSRIGNSIINDIKKLKEAIPSE